MSSTGPSSSAGTPSSVESAAQPHWLPTSAAVRVFAVFASVYFLSTLARAVTATIAPGLTAEFALSASNLGLLAGSYFVGFCAMQLPLGALLDRFGPPRVARWFLSVAVLGCVIFALAQNFVALLIGRTLLGLGLAAGLMAPLTAYRRWYAPGAQLRANSWMLMVGSLGMLMSTLPVQWLQPVWGWRGVFWVWGVLAVLAIVALLLWLPRWDAPAASQSEAAQDDGQPMSARRAGAGFGEIFRNRRFISLVPLTFFSQGGFYAILTLWAGPWLQHVAGQSPEGAAQGLFWINAVMLLVYFFWGMAGPWVAQKAGSLERMAILLGLPGLLILPVVIALGQAADWGWWALYCSSITGLALIQPKLAQAFAPELAGRALTSFNLMTFTGTFAVQWGIGLCIDWFAGMGFSTADAYRNAMLVYWGCCLLAFGWFLYMRERAAQAGAR